MDRLALELFNTIYKYNNIKLYSKIKNPHKISEKMLNLKTKKIILIFLVITYFLSLTINVRATSHNLKFSAGSSFTYEFNVINETYGFINFETGDNMRLKVTRIERNGIFATENGSTYWCRIKYKIFDVSNNELVIDESRDITGEEGLYVLKDPEEARDIGVYIEPYMILYFCPGPVDTYLAELAVSFPEWTASGNSLTFNVSTISEIRQYDEKTGMLSFHQLNQSGFILIQYTLIGKNLFIPGYEFITILGLSSVSIIGIIYLTISKNKLVFRKGINYYH
ncbi:MAG: hypothetical protein ACFE85_12865 [Candidatus Hodarchaeota archaeon]